MQVRVLALDYDGTIARDGRLDPAVRAALDLARAAGISIVLATGRVLDSLRAAAGGLDWADAFVLENGAVFALPNGESQPLAPPASLELVQWLRDSGIDVDVGYSVIAMSASAAGEARTLVRDRNLPLALVFNGNSLMLLPKGVDKGTGLREALRLLGLSPRQAVGIGDAENDFELLDVCAGSIAVAWGSEALKGHAGYVLEGSGPPDLAPFIRKIIREPWLRPEWSSIGRVRADH